MTSSMFEDDSSDMNIGTNEDEDEMSDLMNDVEMESDDEGQLNGDDDEDMLGNGKPGAKKKKARRALVQNGLSKLTPKEINQLKETENLYQSNLYRFQIQELLSEISVKSKVRVKFQKWFKEFKTLIESLPLSQPFEVRNYKDWLMDVKLPLLSKIRPKKDSTGTFRWIKPKSITEIGGWSLNTSVTKLSAYDIAVEMPSEYLLKSELLNHKYHVKRALYLTYIALQIRHRGDEVHFICPDGDNLKPCIQVYVKQKKVLPIRIHCIPPSDYFQVSRFHPDKNNLRFGHFFDIPKPEGEPAVYSTPHYNCSILKDVLMKENNEFVSNLLLKNSNFCEAIKLLKVWLHQRSLNQGHGAFSNFILTMFVGYLAHKNKINNLMSSYQIIRIVFVNLTQADWCTNGISWSTESNTKDWHLQFDTVFLDPTGQLNFTADVSRFTFSRIKFEAKLALEILNSSNVVGFQSMFITKIPFLVNFDNILQLKVTEELIEEFQGKSEYLSTFLSRSGYVFPVLVSAIGQLVEKGLGKRVQLVDVELPRVAEWKLTEKRKNSDCVIRFGLVLNRDLAFKVVEKCDSEDEVTTSIFKQLWGEKSQLRRFRDGSMVETVSFENDEDSKSRVLFHMLQYLLKKHFNIFLRPDREDYLDGQLDRHLEAEFSMLKEIPTESEQSYAPKRKKAKQAIHKTESCPVVLDEITAMASSSFDSLSKILRQLEGLPLDITSVQGTSSILRFSNIFPTPPQRFFSSALLTEAKGNCLALKDSPDGLAKVPKHIEPIGVVVQLEASGKWPDDIKAIERLKCAFLIRIGELLHEQYGLTVQCFPRYLYVLKDGFVFRVRLTYYRELILLKQLRGDDGILRTRDNIESSNIERETLLLPQLTSTLHALHRRFGAFGKTCRLAKRWISSHLLLGYSSEYNSCTNDSDTRFTEESIELLVASLFLQYAPHLSPPNEAQTGFFRFLALLGNMDFKTTALILNFNDKLTKEEIGAIESEFVKRRSVLPLLFIATPEDKLGSVWTKNLSKVTLFRASILAKHALVTLTKDLTSEGGLEDDLISRLRKFYRPDTKFFDAIIWIKKDMIAKKSQSGGSPHLKLQFREYVKTNDELMPVVAFDPIQLYIHELTETFGHLCNFFNDQFGGSFIALVWKPDSSQAVEFKVSQAKGKKLDKRNNLIGLDTESILEEIKLIGDGIVDHIDVAGSGKLGKKASVI